MRAPLHQLIQQARLFLEDYGWISPGLLQRRLRVTAKMARYLCDEIKDGRYARRWVAENEAGRPKFNATRAAERSQPLEQVGARLRAMMPFLDAVEVTADGEVKRVAERKAGVR